jgi:hypothetical protein
MANEEIWIIGTDPPCPRCDTLTRMVTDIVAASERSIPVRHLACTEDAAREFAASLGLEPGTAKDVARKAAIAMDWDGVYRLIDAPGKETPRDNCCPTAATRWSPALDEALRPCQDAAEKAGVLMTPVLVLAGRVYHQGSVPDRDRVAGWIQEVFGQAEGGRSGRHVVEVLGPGCAKCDTLYENVSAAAARPGFAGRVVVRKRTDVGYFVEMGVAVTPALVIDGVVVSKGKGMAVAEVVSFLDRLLST